MVDKTAVDYVPLNKAGDTATNLVHQTGSIGTAVTAVTQAPGTNDMTVSTTAYADAAVAAAASSYATTALDNLAAVQINTSLIPDTTTSYDLGASGALWQATYTQTIELGHATDTTLARSGAGDMTIEGNVVYRAGGTDVPVADGGTGLSSATAYAVLCGGTTGTGAFQSIASVGSAGEVLTSNGAGALPTFQAAAAGAPAGATYITQTSDGTLTNEQALDALATGIMKNTTGTGVVSIAAEGTDYYGPGGTDVVVADGGSGRSSATAYAVICGGTTSTAAHQSIASVGTSGQILTSNGAGALPTFQDAASGSLDWEYITEVTASASATVDFDNVFDGTYVVYRIFGYAVAPATDAQDFWVRIGTGAGPTYQSGASDYGWVSRFVGGSASATEQNDVDAAAAQIETAGNGTGAAWGNDANYRGTVDLIIYNPSDSTYYTTIEANTTYFGSQFSSQSLASCSAFYLATTAVTSIRFLYASGNVATGTFKLYGIRGA